jgi:hypothetical protein
MCKALATVTLGSTAPELGTNMFLNISASQDVTVKVPTGAEGYGTIPATYSGANNGGGWGDGFRGGGWTSLAALENDRTINPNITLKIEYGP